MLVLANQECNLPKSAARARKLFPVTLPTNGERCYTIPIWWEANYSGGLGTLWVCVIFRGPNKTVVPLDLKGSQKKKGRHAQIWQCTGTLVKIKMVFRRRCILREGNQIAWRLRGTVASKCLAALQDTSLHVCNDKSCQTYFSTTYCKRHLQLALPRNHKPWRLLF